MRVEGGQLAPLADVIGTAVRNQEWVDDVNSQDAK